MWQENHLSFWDETINCAGCVVVFLSIIVACIYMFRMITTRPMRGVKP